MYLIDTNVLSKLRKIQKGTCDPAVASWMRSVDPETLFLSVIAIMDMEIGYLRLLRRDVKQAAFLRKWLSSSVVEVFRDRILPLMRRAH